MEKTPKFGTCPKKVEIPVSEKRRGGSHILLKQFLEITESKIPLTQIKQ